MQRSGMRGFLGYSRAVSCTGEDGLASMFAQQPAVLDEKKVDCLAANPPYGLSRNAVGRQ
jgi:hypothetical protein